MKKHWKILGIIALVALVGATVIGAVALAQDSGSGANTPFNFQEKLREAVAGALGITVDQLTSAIDTARQQVLGEAVTAGVLTQDQADQMEERAQQRAEQGFGPGMGDELFGFGMGPFDRGFGHGGFMLGGGENSLISIAADKLGMTVSELTTELRNGKSIADLASEKGVDTQLIVDAYVEQVTTSLDQAVTNGRITQSQADTMLQQLQDRVPDMLNSTHGARMPGWFGGGKGPRHYQPPSDQDTI
jgi:hypothetical protein